MRITELVLIRQKEGGIAIAFWTRREALFLMDATSAKPRINGSMLSGVIGQHVCLVGKNLGVSFCMLISVVWPRAMFPVTFLVR